MKKNQFERQQLGQC